MMFSAIALATALSMWSHSSIGIECRWVEIHLKAFKQCRNVGTKPEYYNVCVAQSLDGMGFEGNQWHYYCSMYSISIDIEDLYGV